MMIWKTLCLILISIWHGSHNTTISETIAKLTRLCSMTLPAWSTLCGLENGLSLLMCAATGSKASTRVVWKPKRNANGSTALSRTCPEILRWTSTAQLPLLVLMATLLLGPCLQASVPAHHNSSQMTMLRCSALACMKCLNNKALKHSSCGQRTMNLKTNGLISMLMTRDGLLTIQAPKIFNDVD